MIRRSAVGLICILLVPLVFAQRSSVVIPSGTPIEVRMIDSLSSDKARPGDTFHASLQRPIVVNRMTLFGKGADITGKVLSVHRSGRLSDPGELELTLVSVRSGNTWHDLKVEPFVIKGDSHAANNVTKIGGGTAAGAIIGGIAGGGKGAAIGAGIGAGAGTTAAAATGKREARVPSEAVLRWVATSPTSGWDWSRSDERARRDDRDRDDDRYRDGDRRRDRGDRDDYRVFSERDQRVIRACVEDNHSDLPPGLAKKDRLPPGLEKQLRRNGTLPPGLAKRVQPLPMACSSRLPHLPPTWARVVLSQHVILVDADLRIADMFDLD